MELRRLFTVFIFLFITGTISAANDHREVFVNRFVKEFVEDINISYVKAEDIDHVEYGKGKLIELEVFYSLGDVKSVLARTLDHFSVSDISASIKGDWIGNREEGQITSYGLQIEVSSGSNPGVIEILFRPSVYYSSRNISYAYVIVIILKTG